MYMDFIAIIATSLWLYFECYSEFSNYWTDLWDKDVGDDSGTMSSIFTTLTTLVLMTAYTTATLPAWGVNHVNIGPNGALVSALYHLVWVGYCCAFPAIFGYTTDLGKLFEENPEFFVCYWFILGGNIVASVLVWHNVYLARSAKGPKRSYYSNKLQASRLYTYLRQPHRKGAKDVLARYLHFQKHSSAVMGVKADTETHQDTTGELMARRNGKRERLTRRKAEPPLESLDRAWFADRKLQFTDELAKRMVRVPAIVWAAFLCGWLVLAVVVILAQYTNDAAQDGIQEFIEDSETMLQLTTVAVESTGAILTFYDTIVAPGMTGNISSMDDAIAAVNGNITPACGFVNEVLRNVTDEVAANLTATYGLEVEASATMTDALMTVYESACDSVLQAAPAFAFMSAFASGEVNTTISTLRTINSEMSDLQSKQQDALDFWTNLKPALYDSWIIGEITAALWTASFMPALIFGYRRNALKVRLGIPNAFEGCNERNRDKEFATYRCYYFVGGYISAVVWSFLLAWVIWTAITSIFRWDVFFDFTFVYTRSIWITWITVTTWDICIRNFVVLPRMMDETGIYVKRPRLWSFFCLAETIALIPTCGFKAFMRVFWILFLSILGQQRVDQGLLPWPGTVYDACFASFTAVLLQDERVASNPIMITVADMLLNIQADSGVKKRSKAWLKMLNRFWLAWMLVNYPQLKYYRWHYLESVEGTDRQIVQAERLAAEAKKEKKEKKKAEESSMSKKDAVKAKVESIKARSKSTPKGDGKTTGPEAGGSNGSGEEAPVSVSGV